MIRNTRRVTVVLSLIAVCLSLSLPAAASPATVRAGTAPATLSTLWEWVTAPVRSLFAPTESLDCRATIDPDGRCRTESGPSSLTSDCRGTIDPDGRCRT